MKAFIDKDTANKWKIYERQTELSKNIPKEWLEKRYGGDHEPFQTMEDTSCDFEWLMKELLKKTGDKRVTKVLKLVKKYKRGIYFDLKNMRKEAKKQGLYQMEFPSIDSEN